ncbi:CHASE3 domain-containing protein [Melissospora conviva]|uniref:sensor histidine kinase n=1 Tax=Melissospora conviva TaxID=3388432 RepID=UPI003C1E5500
MKPSSWSLRQRVVTICVIVASVLVLIAAGGAAVAAQNRTQIDILLNKTGPLRADGQAMLGALVDQQTGVRGYAVTGREADLAPYTGGQRAEADLARKMNALLADQPEIQAHLVKVQELAARWRAEIAEPSIAATRDQGTDAGQAVLATHGGALFDEIRAEVTQLQDSVLVLRNRVADDAERTSNMLVLLLVIAAVVMVVAVVALMSTLNRLFIGPITVLAGQVREIAEGDYDRHIEPAGPPELAQLAGDVDQMRQKIAKDLAEVREARTRIEWVNSQLQKQAEELVRSNRDLEQFAYVASHDLQEPLRKVASFCQLLQRRYAGQLDERADQYIAFAVDGAQRMQRLINDLLAFSRIGRLTTGFTEVDLNKVMGDVAGQTEASRKYADGELTWDSMPTIRGEEPLLTNLLVNLVSNSMKFRRPDVTPRVHISARRVGDEWEITCRDNGIGIEPEFADKIFVIFQRLHSKDAYPGTGIGLAIVKKIVEYHGGRVWVDTDVDEGTAICFTLPASADLDEAQPTADPAPAGDPEPTDTERADTERADTDPAGGAEPAGAEQAGGAEPAAPEQRNGSTVAAADGAGTAEQQTGATDAPATGSDGASRADADDSTAGVKETSA